MVRSDGSRRSAARCLIAAMTSGASPMMLACGIVSAVTAISSAVYWLLIYSWDT